MQSLESYYIFVHLYHANEFPEKKHKLLLRYCKELWEITKSYIFKAEQKIYYPTQDVLNLNAGEKRPNKVFTIFPWRP